LGNNFNSGACDGTGDNTIKHIYLPNDHWRGVFVEPMSLNVRDLVQFMADKNVSHRSIVIKAAATLKCAEPTIKIERYVTSSHSLLIFSFPFFHFIILHSAYNCYPYSQPSHMNSLKLTLSPLFSPNYSPLYEEKALESNSSKPIPHWLRRQINSILPVNRQKARPGWTVEEVRCMTGSDILNEWTARSSGSKPVKVSKKVENR
jgi:hypothetical protein